MSADSSRVASRAVRPAPIYACVLDALDTLLDEGVPRTAVFRRGADVGVADRWTHAFEDAEQVVTDLRQRWPLHPAMTIGVRDGDPALARLVACATHINALARDAGIDIGPLPALAALREVLDEAAVRAQDDPALAASLHVETAA